MRRKKKSLFNAIKKLFSGKGDYMESIFKYEFSHTYYLSSFSKQGVFPEKICLNNGQQISWDDFEFDKNGDFFKMGLGAERHKSGSGGSVNPKEFLTQILHIYDSAALPVQVDYKYYDSYQCQPPDQKFYNLIVREVDGDVVEEIIKK
jgi:hypothetical protein